MILRPVLPAMALLWLLANGEAASPIDMTRMFLADVFDVTASDLRRIDAGQVVSRTLPVGQKHEVATLGIVRIRATPESYVKRLGDIVAFKKDDAVLQIGSFGSTPTVRDLTDLSLEDSDIRSLRACRVGDCDIQLSADSIDRFRREVDWQRPDAAQQANGLMHVILVDYLRGYLAAGASAMMQYADRPETLNMGEEFRSLAEANVGGWEHFGDLRRHLLEYPSSHAATITDSIYWSKERVGRGAVVSITQLAIAQISGNSPVDYAIGSKQLYGSHYYDASLGLTILLGDRLATSPAMYLVYVNRSRIDILGGIFSGVTRRIVSSRARSTVSDQLARMQMRLERT